MQFRLQIDRQTKASFDSFEAAEQAFPRVHPGAAALDAPIKSSDEAGLHALRRQAILIPETAEHFSDACEYIIIPGKMRQCPDAGNRVPQKQSAAIPQLKRTQDP